MEEIEIPEAIRENIELPHKSRVAWAIPLRIAQLLCLSILGGLLFWLLTAIRQPLSPSVAKPEPQTKITNSQEAPLATSDNPPPPAQVPTKAPPAKKSDLLGHLPYQEAPAATLTAIAGNIKLRSPAATKFQQMQAAAQADGITLVAISGFRDVHLQDKLFFGIKEERGQDATQRAEVSAPPGYSEHHTGYAIDIGDGDAPATHVEPSFAETAAFRWLEDNALKYSFELSFPPNNKQGVSYEPWHWRFVGDRHSLETFYKVRN